MSIFATAFSGTMPLGNLMVGALAGQIGATFTLIGSGAICIVIVADFLPQPARASRRRGARAGKTRAVARRTGTLSVRRIDPHISYIFSAESRETKVG
jgi:hypothetical protein